MKDLVRARERFAPAPLVHVVVRKEDIDAERLEGRVAIVLDILFATTTIVTALAAGATAVIPAEDQREARRIAAGLPAGSYHIAGEEHLAAIAGFASPLPLELTRAPGFAGKPLIYSTTNGTVALRHAQRADAVYAAALCNAQATLDHALAHHPGKPLVIICAGSAGALNLEDFHAAGCLVALLAPALDPGRALSDTALAAWAVYRAADAWTTIAASRIGRIVCGVGNDDEVRHAAGLNTIQLVATLVDDRIVRSPIP
ncbi:MAG: 2-phosphosulfolactate phosphatase [Burkholderiales bacterium]|nr:2-phosphosulfolactate phosphatase [Burkholderiales bacterium]